MLKTNNGLRGGNLVGKPHKDKKGNDVGGIKAVVTDANNRPVELEGGEVIINKAASKKHWRELSRINQSAGNGVPINKPIDPHDQDPEEYKEGGKIQFNPNKLPNKWILNYAINIKKNHPEIWKKGGNIYGNQAFENLKRVSDRGYWLDSEEWFYIKWRSFVARHKGDFRIAGVVAMLKWVDKVDRGWQYMKNLIEEEIKKSSDKKSGWKTKKTERMSGGGNTDSNNDDELIVKNYIVSRHPKKDDIFIGGKVDGYKVVRIVKKKKHFGTIYQLYIIATKKNKEGAYNKRIVSYSPKQKKIGDFEQGYITSTKGKYYKEWSEKMSGGGDVVIDETIAKNPMNEPQVGMAIIHSLDENEWFPNVYYVLDVTRENGEIVAVTYGIPNGYSNGISVEQFKSKFIPATEKQVKRDKFASKTLFENGGMTWKEKYNRKYGYSKGSSHDLDEISEDTGVSKKGLQKIYNKGVGARKTNPESVRSLKDGVKRGGKSLKGKMSGEQWGQARVYSAVMGGKASKVDAKELKMSNGGKVVLFDNSDKTYYKGNYHGMPDYTNDIAKAKVWENYEEAKNFAKGWRLELKEVQTDIFGKNPKLKMQTGGSINVGSRVLYYNSRGDIKNGEILREVDNENWEVASGMSLGLVSKEKIIGEAPTKKFLGIFENGGSIEIGDRVKAKKEYGGKSGMVIEKRGSFVVIEDSKGNTESYHESDLIKKYSDGGGVKSAVDEIDTKIGIVRVGDEVKLLGRKIKRGKVTKIGKYVVYKDLDDGSRQSMYPEMFAKQVTEFLSKNTTTPQHTPKPTTPKADTPKSATPIPGVKREGLKDIDYKSIFVQSLTDVKETSKKQEMLECLTKCSPYLQKILNDKQKEQLIKMTK